jgi:hypothetical protein
MHLLKTLKFEDGRSLEIHNDEDPMHPRTEFDNLGTMVCFHRRYNLGDEADGHGYKSDDFSGWDALQAKIKEDHPGCVILPLYLFDHSGLTIRTTSEQFRACDSQGWDWGQVGFIFISREKINEEYGDHGGRTDEQIETYLRGEVETYDQYLTGDIWGFIVRGKPCEACDGKGEESDSCWGFWGSDPAENGMIDHFDEPMKEAIRAGKFEEVSS